MRHRRYFWWLERLYLSSKGNIYIKYCDAKGKPEAKPMNLWQFLSIERWLEREKYDPTQPDQYTEEDDE